MITSYFLNLILRIIKFFIEFLPVSNGEHAISSAVNVASSSLSALWSFLPSTIVSVLAILVFDLVFEKGYILFKIFNWILRRLPTQS